MEFLGFFFDRHMAAGKPIPPEVHPLKFVREMAKRAPRRALLGLKMAVADCIESSTHWHADRLKQADAALRDAGIVTLSEMRRRYWKRFSVIVERGRIPSDQEHRLVKGVTSDGTVPPEQSALLDQSMNDYEAREGSRPTTTP
jgi:hypothetical protein